MAKQTQRLSSCLFLLALMFQQTSTSKANHSLLVSDRSGDGLQTALRGKQCSLPRRPDEIYINISQRGRISWLRIFQPTVDLCASLFSHENPTMWNHLTSWSVINGPSQPPALMFSTVIISTALHKQHVVWLKHSVTICNTLCISTALEYTTRCVS